MIVVSEKNPAFRSSRPAGNFAPGAVVNHCQISVVSAALVTVRVSCHRARFAELVRSLGRFRPSEGGGTDRRPVEPFSGVTCTAPEPDTVEGMSQTQPIDPPIARRPPQAPPKKRRNWFGRIIGLIVLLFVLMLICVPLYAWGRINKVDAMPTGERPAATPGTTYLLVGSDSREGLSRAERAKLGTGTAAGQRTDSIMLLHVPESGPTVLLSLPRDSYVPIPGHGRNKINAAFSFGGPKLLIQTVESVTGLRVDHYVEIGFGGFAGIVDSIGGVKTCLPKAIKDPDSHLDLPAGCQQLDGRNALGYVRMRKADPLGDLGRVQ